MAETELTVYKDAATAAFVAFNVDGHRFDNRDGRTRLHVVNASGSDKTYSVVGQRPCNHPDQVVHDHPETVPSGTMVPSDPISPLFFNDEDDYVHVTAVSVTGLSCAAIRMPELGET